MSTPEQSPVAALTEALVDANDRLLGLIGLTDDTSRSLDEAEQLNTIAERALTLVALDRLELETDPGSLRIWGRGDSLPEQWTADRDLDGHGRLTLRCWRGDTFDTGDVKLLTAVANVMANAVRISRMHAEALRQALLTREHETAARITAAALAPLDQLPQLTGVDVHASLSPARTTGGDLWICRTVDDALWFAVGDVSGKGLPAAVLMTTVVSAINAAVDRHHQAGLHAAFEAVDQWVHAPLSNAAMFCTLALGRWSLDNGLQIVNAGHSPVVLRQGGAATRIDASIPPLGVVGGLEPAMVRITPDTGDLLVLASDGLTEQRNNDGDTYGEDTFDAAVDAHATAGSAPAVSQRLLAELATFADGREQDDDQTLLTLLFTP